MIRLFIWYEFNIKKSHCPFVFQPALLNPDQIICIISLFIQLLLPNRTFINVKDNICRLLLFQLNLLMNTYMNVHFYLLEKRDSLRIVNTKDCSRFQTSNQYSSIIKKQKKKFLPLIMKRVIKTLPKTVKRSVLQEQSTAKSC